MISSLTLSVILFTYALVLLFAAFYIHCTVYLLFDVTISLSHLIILYAHMCIATTSSLSSIDYCSNSDSNAYSTCKKTGKRSLYWHRLTQIS